jgi:SAM-dependent methyltransferase
MRDFAAKNIIGVDVNPHFLAMCQFEAGEFVQISPLPPMRRVDGAHQFPDESLDFIVAYSVFSHLSEEACLAWVGDFYRTLRPGGMVAVTTRARWFFDQAESLQGQGLTGYPKGLSEMFESFDHARARYDSGEFVHANTPLVGDGEHYGESFIPQGYAANVYGAVLELVAFHEQPSEHPIIVFRK